MALSDNLESYWSCDEASGTLFDAHGSNDLSDNNTVTTGTGIISGARSFAKANNEYFDIADNASVSTGDIDFTWSAWFKLSTNTNYMFCITKEGGVSAEYRLHIRQPDGVGFRWQVQGGATTGTVSWGTQPSTGTWYHVVCWHDSVNNQIGITVNDGTPVTSSHSAGVNDSNSSLRFGDWQSASGTYDYDGLMDEIGFWKRVLTASEITELYNSGSGRDYDYIIADQDGFTSIGTLGTGTRSSAGTSTTITTSATAEAGNVIVVAVAKDNTSTTDGNTNEVTSVTDSASNTYTKAYEYTNGQGGAAAGATVAVFFSKLTSQLSSGGTITVNHDSQSDVACSAWEFSTTFSTLAVAGTPQVEAADAADPGSMTISGLTSGDYILFRAIASESETATSPTVTTNYTAITGAASTTAGAATANICIAGEFRVVSASTGGTSDPTLEAVDSASVFVAIGEGAAPTGHPTMRRLTQHRSGLWLPTHRPAEIGRQGTSIY